MKCGYKPSKLTGNEPVFTPTKNIKLPARYSYKNFLGKIMNQGDTYECVPYSIATHLNWNHNVDKKKELINDNKIVTRDIYNARRDKSKDDGMQIIDALNYLKSTGTRYAGGIMKIRNYAKVNSDLALKYALVMNGPCVAALRVYHYGTEFWNREYQGQEMLGGHAIAIVGYNDTGFIIRNSWGTSYGNRGYSTIKYEDFKKFLEIWTIFD